MHLSMMVLALTSRADGGGGSSYTDPILATNVTHIPGVRNGHGLLIITYAERPNCASADRDSVTVTVEAIPEVNAGKDTFNCPGLEAVFTSSGADSYLWKPGALTGTSINIDPNTSETYTLIGTIGNYSSTDEVIYLPFAQEAVQN